MRSTGQVLGWGDETSGSLGNGRTSGFSTVPVRALLPTRRAPGIAVRAGHDTVRSGLLGNGSTTASALPVQAQLPAGSFAIGTGGGVESEFSLALVLRPAVR